MRVMNASVRMPAAVPIDDQGSRQRQRVVDGRFMNAPRPHFTSSTSASLPSASFLLITDAADQRQALDGAR